MRDRRWALTQASRVPPLRASRPHLHPRLPLSSPVRSLSPRVLSRLAFSPSEEILRGVLGADLVGFHIYDYARHFHTASSRVLGTGGAEGVTEGNEGIFDHATRRSIAVDAFPIGIEPSKFEACLEQPVVKDKIIDLQRRFDGKKVLLGIDRLDYVKGIPHKLKAIECFLRAHPSWRGKVVLLQIAVPSRSEVPGYQKLRNNVHKQVGRINGEFGSIDNVPIHYLDQSMSFQELCALYYRADIMFVTSLRDGMNLVSFEFIACQREKCGVLVLSEFAGAAQALGAGALLVNPYNTDEVASALHEALNMSMSEREQRFDYLSTHINQHTAQTWAEKFVGSLRHARQASNYDSGPFSGLEESSELPHREVIASYKACERVGGRRLLVFGLLGTLIDYARFVNLEHLMPSVRRNLAEIAASPQNTVIVCSGRERALMNEWLGDLPIWLVAENGLWLRPPMGAAEMEPPEWEQMKEDIDGSWMAALKPIFRYFEARTPEAFTEVQEYTMTWHFQDSDEDFAEVQAGDLQAHLVKVSGHVPVEVSLDVKRVEVRPYGISKGAAIATILERLQAEAEAEAAAEAVAILEGDEDLSQPWQAGVGGADGQPPPPQQQQHPPKTPPRQDGATRGAGGSRTGSLEEVDVGDHSAAAHAAVAAVGLAHRTSSSGQLSDESGTSPGSPGVTPKSLFGWVFCAGQTLSRDEDMFSNLQALTKDDEGNDLTEAGMPCPRVFTCCVGKTLSQAEFRMEDCSEVAGLLDLLANVSADEQPVADESWKQLPLPSSCLERLKELQRELEGKQLLLILDFEGCAQAVANPSPAMARVLKRYPAAVVQRTPWNAPTADPTESSERDLRSSGLGLSSKDLFDMEQRAREREEGITKADLFSTNPSTAAAALEALGSISGVQIVSYGAHGFGMGGSGEKVETGEMVVEKGVDSYRPALESCLLVLQARFGENSQITIEDNTFSLTVSHRGVEDEVAEDTRLAVNTLLEEDYPMLRSDEERTQIHVRPDPGWTRARMVEWIATQVVDAVEEKLRIKNKHRAMPIYLGEDPSFRHLNAISGLEIVITSGPGIDGYYLRHARQVDELLDWLAEQHAAGVTVRGGKIKYPKLPGGVPLAAGSGSAIAGTQRQAHAVAAPGAAKGKRVQISLPN
jgi:trehalose-phosphatase